MFTPYYSKSLNETILTQAEDTLVRKIAVADVDELKLIREDAVTETVINPNYGRSREYLLIRKSIARRNQAIRHQQATKPKPKSVFPLMDLIFGFQYRMIVNDEWWRRFVG